MHDLPEFRRIMRLKQHQRAVICERLHHPLIAIAAPSNQIAPPLVSGFMCYNLLRHCQPVAINPRPALLFRIQERETGKKYETGPSLAHRSGHLRNRQFTVGKRSKISLIELHRFRRSGANHPHVLRWRGRLNQPRNSKSGDALPWRNKRNVGPGWSGSSWETPLQACGGVS